MLYGNEAKMCQDDSALLSPSSGHQLQPPISGLQPLASGPWPPPSSHWPLASSLTPPACGKKWAVYIMDACLPCHLVEDLFVDQIVEIFEERTKSSVTFKGEFMDAVTMEANGYDTSLALLATAAC